MAAYILTNKALEDLSNIWDYTYETWSENRADKYYQMIIESCNNIGKNPELGKIYDDIIEDL